MLSAAPKRSVIHTLPNNNEVVDYLSHLLKQCITIHQIQKLHTRVFLLLTQVHPSSSAFLGAGLVSAYSKFGLLNRARKVFDTMPLDCISNILLWNSILRAHNKNDEFQHTLRLYHRMRCFRVFPDAFTFPLVIRACAALAVDSICKNVLSHVVHLGFQNHLHVCNELLNMYGKLGRMDVATNVFDRMIVRTHISWNTMVSGFSLNYDCDSAFKIFRKMKLQGFEPNPVTWTSLLSSYNRCRRFEQALELYNEMRRDGVDCTAEALALIISVCANSNALCTGEVMHGYTITAGFEDYSFVKNSLLCMYGKNGAVRDAEYLFSDMKPKNIVTWNILISCYAESGLCDEAFAIFLQLKKLNIDPAVRPNVISWSAVIGCFASNGRCEESLHLFRQMQHSGILSNSVLFCSILSACAELSALILGREIHGHVIRGSLESNILVGNGLVNMYTKCGSVRYGNLVFEKIIGKDTYSWNTMIVGYGMHGLGEKALQTFKRMIESGYEPDGVTFVACLSSCSHAGLVSEGRKLFDQMKGEFKFEPQLEHYSCMVDLLGRAGFLKEAYNMVKTMPMEPNVCVLGALLNSCSMYKNTDVAQETASLMYSHSSAMTGSYMLLSNIYAASGKWEDSAKVRISARTKGLKKIAGLSWIEVKKKVSMFSSGEAVETGMHELYSILQNLSLQMEEDASEYYF
ncbi:putative pentatricopeptide repeat-containing protein At1g17630 [Apium graveolens]|uniref:putative pentatricopeptide repeat-containing protein At1g17630 n=1 Tax=Apium graveolens TaxID=4045 RepID=UPI003D7B07D2